MLKKHALQLLHLNSRNKCLFLFLILMAHTLFHFEKNKNLKKRVHNTYCKNKSALMAHCEKYPDQMIRCRSSLRRYVHSGIFAFDVVKYWLVNEK